MKILLTNGVGDIVATECWWADYEKQAITHIYYATRAMSLIREIFQALPNYPKLKDDSRHIPVFTNWKDEYSFVFKNEVIEQNPKMFFPVLESVEDFGIIPKLCEVMRYTRFGKPRRKYTGSSFANQKMADVTFLGLPKRYVAIHPFSSNDGLNWERGKSLNGDDWDVIVSYLKDKNLTGVIVNNTTYYRDNKFNGSVFSVFENFTYEYPDDKCIINLTDVTTLPEAFEVVKGGIGFIGIESCFSVLAAKMFTKGELIAIKGQTTNVNDFSRNLYYYPRTTFEFIHPSKIQLPLSPEAPKTETPLPTRMVQPNKNILLL